MDLITNAFDAGETIPNKFTCQGENVSPPLVWKSVPTEAKSLALICDDPDSPGGIWSHWVLYDIPPEREELPEDVPTEGRLSWGGAQGRNDFGDIGYGGPCPPKGTTHRYYWRLYALDAPCELSPGATREQLLDWIESHTLDESELMGRFTRS